MPVKLSVHLSAEILQAQREWNDIFNVTKKKKKSTLSGNVTFKNEGGIEFFFDKQILGEFITTRSALQGMLEGILQAQMKECYYNLLMNTQY